MGESKQTPCPGRVFEDGSMIEECWNGREAYYYVGIPGVKGRSATFDKREDYGLDADKKNVLVPLVDEALEKGVIILPREPKPYGKPEELFEKIRSFINKWGEIDEIDEKLAAGYVMLTALFDKCPSLPFLNFRGPPGTGKTRVAMIVLYCSYRGIRSSGVSSFSATFRACEVWRGTVLLNEGDLKDTSETADLTKWLNERFEATGVFMKTNKDTLKTQVFRCFGPTILTTRADFRDDALTSRCLLIPMREKTRKGILANLPREFFAEAEEIRNELLQFRFDNYHKFNNDFQLEFENVSPRMNQILQCLGSLAKSISPEFFKTIEDIASELQRRTVDAASQSDDGLVVNCFFDIEENPKLTDAPGSITPKDIADKIKEEGGKTSASAVGRRLRSLGFKLKRSGSTRSYSLEDERREQLKRTYRPEAC